MIYFNSTDLMTGHYYNYKLYSMNVIYISSLFGSIKVLIATVPAQLKKPEFVTSSLTDLSITVTWDEPSYIGGIPVERYDLWIDDGADVFPSSPIKFTPPAGLKTFTYKFTGLIASLTYQIKIQAVNEIGSSVMSERAYLVCADLPGAPSAPILEGTTATSISVAWNEPASDGGAPISGYKLYMNDILADDMFNMIYDGSNYPSAISFTQTKLTPGKYYRFKVSAMNRNGESAKSVEAKFLAADFPGAPSQPYWITSSTTQITIGWYPPTDNGGG